MRTDPEIRAAQQDIKAFIKYVFRWETEYPHNEWHELADKESKLCIVAPPDYGKSENLFVARTLFELGQNPDLRTMVTSSIIDLSRKLLGMVEEVIEPSEKERSIRYGRIFPHIIPDEPWAATYFRIRRTSVEKDFTCQAAGIGGTVVGARADRGYIDDPMNFKNSLTREQRQKIVEWIVTELLTRIRTNEGGKIICIMPTWHKEDVARILARDHGFRLEVYSGVREDGCPAWALRGQDWLDDQKDTLAERNYKRFILQEFVEDEFGHFQETGFDLCKERGKALRLEWARNGFDGKILVGVDLALRKGETADKTAFHIDGIVKQRNGLPVPRVLGIEKDRWNFTETIDKVKDIDRRYSRGEDGKKHYRLKPEFLIEDNAYQKALVEYLERETDIKVKGVTTTSSKNEDDVGLPAMARDINAGRWIIPPGKEVDEWIQGCLAYTPDTHTEDDTMASYQVWKEIRETTRQLVIAGPEEEEDE